jgi:cold shock CspA family protein
MGPSPSVAVRAVVDHVRSDRFVPMSEQAARSEQATVSAFHPDGSATVLRDDGVLVDVPASAVAEGGWRSLRQGQRVTLLRGGNNEVRAALRPV